MVKSMTGYGKASLETDGLSIQAEIKTLNSKTFDAYIKINSNGFSEKEIELKNLLAKHLERGKVSLQVVCQSNVEAENPLQVNMPLAKAYHSALKAAATALGETSSPEIFRMVMQMPDVYSRLNNADNLERDWQQILETVEKAVLACDSFRIQEGESAAKAIAGSIAEISAGLSKIEVLEPERTKKYRERIRQQVAALVSDEGFDANRFEQELIYYAEKIDISEEKVRLKNHLQYFSKVLAGAESNGKKLGFLSQEIGREINTIGSKANDAAIQQLVVGMKEELEKIKEQVLNVL